MINFSPVLVLVRKHLDVLFEPLLHDLSTDVVIHSLDPTRSFLVRNGVKSRCCITCVLDGHLNRMRGRTLVCGESGVQEVEEVALCVWVSLFQALAFVQASDAAEVSEALLEPEIVPPLHSHEIAEPHVRELVKV